jgi:hypothetical protein
MNKPKVKPSQEKTEQSKPGPKLTSEQRASILVMLAENEAYATIARKVGCSWNNVEYYADKHATEIAEGVAKYKANLIGRGLIDRQKRIERLQWLADLVEDELRDKGLWFDEIKVASTGDSVPSPVFNHPIIDKYLKIQEQIAKELGEWVEKKDISGDPVKMYIGVDLDKV